MYEDYFSHLVVMRYLVMPHVKHVCLLLPLARPHVRHLCVLLPHLRHAHLDLHTVVSLKGRTTCIWSFGCGFACATAMGYAGFRLLFGIIIIL